jgi:hypothetical protein
MVLYLCVLIVFSLCRDSLKLILVDEPLSEVVLSQEESRCNQECDWHVNCRFSTLPSSSPEIIISGDFQSPPCCQNCVPHTYHYLCAILVYIPIANLSKHSHLFHIVSTQPTIYDMFSIVMLINSHHSILKPHPCLGLIFKTLRKSLELFGYF